MTVEVHHSSASSDNNSVSDVSDPIPDYDEDNHNAPNGNNSNKKSSRTESGSLSTDEGIYHEDIDDLDDLVPDHHRSLDDEEEDDEDELHDNEVSFSPHHQEDLVAIRNKRPKEGDNVVIMSRRASDDAAHEDTARIRQHTVDTRVGAAF